MYYCFIFPSISTLIRVDKTLAPLQALNQALGTVIVKGVNLTLDQLDLEAISDGRRNVHTRSGIWTAPLNHNLITD